jgi:DtxR family Mn-dependent transcriptional regulator
VAISELSVSTQNYLKAMWSLQEWSDAPLTPTLLAARLGVRVSTVSDAVRKLTAQGLVEHEPYGGIALTAQGRRDALEMVRRHRLIETFLVEALGYRWDQVHDEAEVLEHAVSDFMVEQVDAFLDHPSRDPHGDPIPGPDGGIELPQAQLLSRLEPVGSVRVERISDADPGLLQFLAEREIGIGTRLVLQESAPYSDALEVLVEGKGRPVVLGRSATDAVWASPVTHSA